jgi:hypothetical protein
VNTAHFLMLFEYAKYTYSPVYWQLPFSAGGQLSLNAEA